MTNQLRRLMNVVAESDGKRNEDELAVCLMINNAIKEEKNISELPGINWLRVNEKISSHDSILLELHHRLVGMVDNLDAVGHLNELIAKDPYLSYIESKYQNDGEPSTMFIKRNEQLDKFREKFVSQMTLPPNILGKGAKPIVDYIQSNKKQDYWYCIKAYKELVGENMLDYNEDTFYSFVSRMANDYQGESIPDKIIWKGKIGELFYFLYWFSDGGDGRLPKKASSFFVDLENKPFKSSGAINYYKGNPPIRLEKILKRIIR